MSMVEEWLEILRLPFFESKTPISGSKTKTVKTKRNASHLDDIKGTLQ